MTLQRPSGVTDKQAYAREFLSRCRAKMYVPAKPRPQPPAAFQAIACPEGLPAEIAAALVKLNADWKAMWVRQMQQFDVDWAEWSEMSKALEAEQQVDRVAWLRWVHVFRDEDFRQPLFVAIRDHALELDAAEHDTPDHALNYLLLKLYTPWLRSRLKPVIDSDKSPYED